MSDNDRIASEESKARYSKVSPQDFVGFLNEKGSNGIDTKCLYCQSGEISVFPSPDGKMAAMVSSPIPDGSGLAIWSYVASCTNCGHLLFFSASFVSKYVELKKS